MNRDILDLLGATNPFHQVKYDSDELYWFHQLIEEEKRLARLVEEGSIADFDITSEPEPFLGMFNLHIKPIKVIERIDLTPVLVEGLRLQDLHERLRDD